MQCGGARLCDSTRVRRDRLLHFVPPGSGVQHVRLGGFGRHAGVGFGRSEVLENHQVRRVAQAIRAHVRTSSVRPLAGAVRQVLFLCGEFVCVSVCIMFARAVGSGSSVAA